MGGALGDMLGTDDDSLVAASVRVCVFDRFDMFHGPEEHIVVCGAGVRLTLGGCAALKILPYGAIVLPSTSPYRDFSSVWCVTSVDDASVVTTGRCAWPLDLVACALDRSVPSPKLRTAEVRSSRASV